MEDIKEEGITVMVNANKKKADIFLVLGSVVL